MSPDSSPPLPQGTDTKSVGSWEARDDAKTRLCWSLPAALPENLSHLDVRAVVEQGADGTLVDRPIVYLGEHGWSPSDARTIAEALHAVADVAVTMANPVAPVRVPVEANPGSGSAS